MRVVRLDRSPPSVRHHPRCCSVVPLSSCAALYPPPNCFVVPSSLWPDDAVAFAEGDHLVRFHGPEGLPLAAGPPHFPFRSLRRAPQPEPAHPFAGAAIAAATAHPPRLPHPSRCDPHPRPGPVPRALLADQPECQP